MVILIAGATHTGKTAYAQKLLEKYGAEAMWVDSNNAITYSPGFRDLIRT